MFHEKANLKQYIGKFSIRKADPLALDRTAQKEKRPLMVLPSKPSKGQK